MGEPSPSAAEHPESDASVPLKELIQLYQTEHALLLKHQEEVERRRAAVRAAAVQEASEILLSTRQEIRRVLVQTRRSWSSSPLNFELSVTRPRSVGRWAVTTSRRP
jgi:hypothetical protein